MKVDYAHLIPATAQPDRRGRVRARCGELVDDKQPDKTTCPDCIRLEAQDAASIAALDADEPDDTLDDQPRCIYCNAPRSIFSDYCSPTCAALAEHER